MAGEELSMWPYIKIGLISFFLSVTVSFVLTFSLFAGIEGWRFLLSKLTWSLAKHFVPYDYDWKDTNGNIYGEPVVCSRFIAWWKNLRSKQRKLVRR